MQVNSIVQIIGSGNFSVAEQEWMTVVESPDSTPEQLLALKPVLEALLERGQEKLAESLAWAAVETISQRESAQDALDVAKPYLLLINRSSELRAQIAELYRKVFANRAELEVLIEASGIAGGRPPRRAIRTLDVCLGIRPGSYLVSRHDDSVARAESIDPSTWYITIIVNKGAESLGPVECADEYARCDENDFRVLRQFDPDRLRSMAVKEPAAVVESILKTRAGLINSDELEQLITAGIVAPADWTKWWARARAAIKRSPHVRIQGRAPYQLQFVAEASSYEQEFEERFSRLRCPAEQLTAFETYLRECKARNQPPDAAMLRRLREPIGRRGDRLEKGGARAALPERLLEWRIASEMGEEQADGAAIELLASAKDPGTLIRTCDSPALWAYACDCLEKAKPDNWEDVVLALLPAAPVPAFDDLAGRLEHSGITAEKIEQVIERILSDVFNCFEALCWLWDKGLSYERWEKTPPITLLSKLLWLMAEINRNETIERRTVRRIRETVRATLSARKYERFIECLSQIESGMGSALRTQIQRLDNLGRNVHEDLLNCIRRQFPELYARPVTPLWAMEDVLFSTEAGIARWESDIHELVNVKMKENARAIGEAAEKGDLSENSEYKFALEERDLLRARLRHMQGQMSKARRILPEEVPTDHISVGSKVQFRHVETGQPFEATFLGPFDAISEERIYNYEAPFGQEVMGLRVGDQVDLSVPDPEGAYEVTAIGSWEA